MLLSAALTAFYMTRLYVLVFFGESRSSAKEKAHLHESPKVMTLPLLILSVLALSGGWFGAPVKITAGEEVAASGSHWVMAVSVVAALIGAAIGWSRYSKKTKEEKVRDPIPLDRAYGWIFGKGASALAQGTGRFLEDGFFQGTIRALGAATELSGNLIRVFQSGSMQAYLLIMMAATLAVIGWFFFGVGGYGKF
jgi:NADH-quinone oxidoreductase subunit L